MNGERALVDWLRRHAPRADGLVRGVGDDAAVVRCGRDPLVVTSDMLVEGIDFERSWMPLPLLGWKALAASISDVAAMGAIPRHAFASVAVPAAVGSNGARAILGGLMRLARRRGISVAGGDLSSSPGSLVIDVTLLGSVRRPRYRVGARPGDDIAVTGPLGLAALGLARLRAGVRHGSARGVDARLIRAQLRPDPDPALALALAPLATAMTDVSDGLSTDLGNICRASGVGAEIDALSIPLAPAAAGPEATRLEAALHGGEDFCLLLTYRPRQRARVEALGATTIGTVKARRGLRIRVDGHTRSLRERGFDHFPARPATG